MFHIHWTVLAKCDKFIFQRQAEKGPLPTIRGSAEQFIVQNSFTQINRSLTWFRGKDIPRDRETQRTSQYMHW